MNSAYSKIVSCATNRDYNTLIEIQNSLFVERMKMDKFFTLFLDKFERKMDPDNTNTPIWTLYKAKLKEYADIQQAILAAKYYLTKPNV